MIDDYTPSELACIEAIEVVTACMAELAERVPDVKTGVNPLTDGAAYIQMLHEKIRVTDLPRLDNIGVLTRLFP